MDLASRKDTAINSSAASHPDISDSILVWHDESNGVSGLALYDLETRARSYITKGVITKGVDCNSVPAISGSRIWSANSCVYLHDIPYSHRSGLQPEPILTFTIAKSHMNTLLLRKLRRSTYTISPLKNQ